MNKKDIQFMIRAKAINAHVLLLAIFLIIINIIIIQSVTKNIFYIRYHTTFQLLAYLLICNITVLLFYNFNYSIFSKKIKNLFYFILGASVLYIYIISFYPALDTNGDNAGYLIRANSLITGNGFRDLFLPGEPYNSIMKSLSFSLLNIPFILIFGFNNYIGLKLLPLISTFGAFFFIYKYFEDKLEKDNLLLLLVILVLFSKIIHFSTLIMTDNVFLLLLFGIIYFTEKLINNKAVYSKLKYYFYFCIISFSLFFTYLTREAGISLVCAVPLFLLLKKRFKELITVALIILLLFSVYIVYSSHLQQLNIKNTITPVKEMPVMNRSWIDFYINKILADTKIDIKYIWRYVLVLTQDVIGDPNRKKYDNLLFNILILLIVLAGLYAKYIKKLKLNIYDIFTPILLIIITLFFQRLDYVAYSRYIIPLIPFVFYYFILGTEFILFKIKLHKSYILLILMIIFCLILRFNFEKNSLKVYKSNKIYIQSIKNFKICCKWIKENTPEDAVIGTRKESISYLWAGRKSICYYPPIYDRYDQHSKEFENNTLKYYKENNLSYVILDRFSGDAEGKIFPIIKNNPPVFTYLYETDKPDSYVYKINRKFIKY